MTLQWRVEEDKDWKWQRERGDKDEEVTKVKSWQVNEDEKLMLEVSSTKTDIGVDTQPEIRQMKTNVVEY